MRDRGVICGSASKAYAMTGWRCGWTLGPKRVIGAANALQSHSTSNACSITQKAVVAGADRSAERVTEMLDEYRKRRDQFCEWLAAEPRLRLVKPAGAFYLFPDVCDFLSPDGIRTTAELAQALLDDRAWPDAWRSLRRARFRPHLVRRLDGRPRARHAKIIDHVRSVERPRTGRRRSTESDPRDMNWTARSSGFWFLFLSLPYVALS